MELNWSTFVLEIINFLILVWILKRFLYRPVLDVIARRRAGIEKTLADAKALQAEAGRVRGQYEGRLEDWDRERRQARATLDGELEAERLRGLAALQATLQQEREKADVAQAHRQQDATRRIEETALKQAARFATRLLEKSAGPDTQERLVALVTGELGQLPEARIAAIRNNHAMAAGEIQVTSAFPLADAQRLQLEQALSAVTGPGRSLRFELDSTLLAGVRITLGAWVLGANVRDELQGFVALAQDR